MVSMELEMLVVCLLILVMKTLNSVSSMVSVLSVAFMLMIYFLMSSSEYSSFLTISLFMLMAITDVFILILSFSFSSMQYTPSKVWLLSALLLSIMILKEETSTLMESAMYIIMFPLLSALMMSVALKLSTSIL